jgi:hypothetical protein
MNSGFAGRFKEVESALLDYQRTPGKYSLLLRRPPILFSSIKEVLLLASGRLPEGAPAPSLAIQRAAGFFVRTALLYPAADHYALLGLDRSADAAAIKERYRQMMRLTHPDFASSAAASGNWPADAAARINEAYEVLASDARRRSYDEKLNPPAAPAPHRSPSNHSLAHARATASAPAPDPRRLLKRMAGAFGVLGVIVLAASLLARGPDRDSLVQRPAPQPSSAPVVLARSGQAQARVVTPAPEPAILALTEVVPPPAQPAIREAMAVASASSEVEPIASAAAPIRTTGRLPVAPAPSATSATVATSAPSARSAPIAPPAPTRIVAVSLEPPIAPIISTAAPFELTAQASPTAVPVARNATAAARDSAPAVSLAEAHNLLSLMLQQMESGSGERVLSGLDRNTRNSPPAQALARQYNGIVGGSHSVKISNVLLKAEPREDRLLVKGQVLLDIGDFGTTRAKELSLEAEFARRGGTVVMTRLAPGQMTGATAQ